MRVHREQLAITATGSFDVTDVTANVEKILLASGIGEASVPGPGDRDPGLGNLMQRWKACAEKDLR